MLLLNQDLEIITEFTVTKTPLYAEHHSENQWRVLKVKSEGEWRELIYKENTYPSNPTLIKTIGKKPTKEATILFKKDEQVIKTHLF